MTSADDCVIIIDKPPGLASHEVTSLVKRIAGAKRAGHAGTLDPDVSGVLPVALGRATKLIRYIAGKEKTYVGIMKFRRLMDRTEVEALFKKYTGELVQTPPRMSAVRKAPRKRTVHALRLLELSGRLALFEARVDAGTYIRTLCDDMGRECGGARMVELRRTAVGAITEGKAHRMTELVDAVWLMRNRGDGSAFQAMLVPPEALIGLRKAHIRESALPSVLSGAQIMMPGVEKIGDAKKGESVAVYCGPRFIGVGRMELDAPDILPGGRGVAIRLERVHAER